jgi:transposase
MNHFRKPGPFELATAGAKLLYLPPYSPDFKPIEQLFAKLKALLRKAAKGSVENLWNRIAHLLDAFQPDECANYFPQLVIRPAINLQAE